MGTDCKSALSGPEFLTTLKLTIQDIGKYKNIAAIKLGIKNTINYTKFAFKSTDNYLDIIIHAKGNKFYVVVEGVAQEKSTKEIISIIDNAPTGKTARLLSCNDESAAIALSIETKKPFYASDGWVEINKNGDVFSQKDFYLYNRGSRGAKGSNYTKGNAPEGVEYLRLGDGVTGAGNLVPSSLITKLTQQGATKLKAWTSGKTLNYKSLLGTNHTGVTAEAKIFEELESAIGNKNVLATIEDGQGRLSVVLERPGQTHQVVSVHPTSTGELKMTTFEPAYNPNLNTSIPVPASVNKLVPDYIGTQYMHPLQGNTVVKIEMSGNRATDFVRSRQQLGISIADEQSSLYTWHHMDDFEVINGKVYCTMQLVQKSAHQGTGVFGMAHSGSASQWRSYFGSGY